MNKSDAMQMVNDHIGGRVLKGSGRNSNTHFSNIINRSTKQVPHVWWFNIPPQKFRNELHLLCAKNPGLIWLRLDAGAIPNPGSVFRVRSDKDLIDLVIAIGGNRHLRDVNSGGTGYDFRPHIAYEWDDDLMGDTQASATRISGRDKAGETDGAHNLHAFLRDFPQVSKAQALEAVRARVKASGVVHSDREIVSGTPVFKGTRVFVRSLFEHLEEGYTIEAFLHQFPTTEREQVVKALQAASALLESVAYETAAR